MIDWTVFIGIDDEAAANRQVIVDNAGVVQLVAIDGIAFADESGDRADVGGVAGGKQEHRFGSLESSQLSAANPACNELLPVTSGLALEPQPSESRAERTAADVIFSLFFFLRERERER